MNKSLLSIDYASESYHISHNDYRIDVALLENLETVDYLKEGDVGFKKKGMFLHGWMYSYVLMLLALRKRRSTRHGGRLQSQRKMGWRLTSSPWQ